ncbi:hypothetical protein A1O1_08478 [Capronia coronata CBS 617.96]|uniref:Uncharacterized protein n=1 Tax=Capronia coronata CBS 617.96 TaxID=1182541 RepID=W9YDG7_9EURO|nr:uncharacterized protein A1O1_08478 [Capronia coronata CBS 617.96]EXJ80334.1 hypothetical protein A1O1_08478 [Capronia coronata CBS 617.96]
MSTPTIEVLGISTAAAEEHDVLSNLEDKSAPHPRLRLHGRITVFDQDGSFDTVNIRLRGAIRTRIGAQLSVEKLPISTELRSNLDFKPVYSASQQQTDEQHLDFICPVPSTSERCKSSHEERSLNTRHRTSTQGEGLDAILPSMTITGSTYITRVTALKDRHLVHGSCDVLYWLEALFLRCGSREVVRKLSCPVDISSLAMPMEVEVSPPLSSPSSASSNKSHETDRVEQLAKPYSGRPINRFFHSQAHPELSVHMPKRLGYLISDSSSMATGCRRLSIPVAVDVVLPSPSRSTQQLQARESTQTQAQTGIKCLKCSVKAKWFTRKVFTTGPSAVETAVHSTTVSIQDLSVTLPPLYTNTPGSDLSSHNSIPSSISTNYTTSMDIDLLLPESVTSPSVSSELLDISYTLDLSMKFESEEMLKGPFMANFRLPVTLRAAEPYSVIGRHCLDPLLGYIEENAEELLYAPPPYMP